MSGGKLLNTKCKTFSVVHKNIDSNSVQSMVAPEKSQTVQTVQPHSSQRISIQTVNAPYYPAYLQGAYNLSGKYTGAGQIIAIVDAYGYPSAYGDLYSFCHQFGLTTPTNVTTLQALSAKPAAGKFNFMVYKMKSTLQNDPDWSIEQALDIQWAHVSAPLASILLVQAASSSISDLLSAIQYAISAKANVISMSWGTLESSYVNSSIYTSVFSSPNVTFLASSGDAVGVYYPSVLSTIVSVGGTSLTITGTTIGTSTTYSRTSEKVWFTSSNDGEGCGISQYVSIPSYQVNKTTSSSHRSVPDLVSDADPNTGVIVYNTFYSKGSAWYQVGGTSLASPFMAGIVASANSARVTARKSTFTTATLLQACYQLLTAGNTVNYATSIYDIIIGTDNGFSAKKGYDVPSGVGAPIGDSLINYLSLV